MCVSGLQWNGTARMGTTHSRVGLRRRRKTRLRDAWKRDDSRLGVCGRKCCQGCSPVVEESVSLCLVASLHVHESFVL